jgi:hypothetical protein
MEFLVKLSGGGNDPGTHGTNRSRRDVIRTMPGEDLRVARHTAGIRKERKEGRNLRRTAAERNRPG